MIVFERTEKIPQYGDTFYDNIRLEISGGYETTLDDYLRYFIVFLQAIFGPTFTYEQIFDILKEYEAEPEDA